MENAIKANDIDLVAMGTHGRTGTMKLLLGSVAEEIFRRSPVPVLTMGLGLRGGAGPDAQFRRVLLATDFENNPDTAVRYAASVAQENHGLSEHQQSDHSITHMENPLPRLRSSSASS